MLMELIAYVATLFCRIPFSVGSVVKEGMSILTLRLTQHFSKMIARRKCVTLLITAVYGLTQWAWAIATLHRYMTEITLVPLGEAMCMASTWEMVGFLWMTNTFPCRLLESLC